MRFRGGFAAFGRGLRLAGLLGRLNALLERFQLRVVHAVHRVHQIVGLFDDVDLHVFADGFLNIVFQLFVEHLALLDGQLAFFNQLAHDGFGFFLRYRHGAYAGENQLANAFSELFHNDAPFVCPS